MAKIGEGDPRWIAEERPDATNVNNWHWSEKNASAWSKDKIKNILEGAVLKTEGLGDVKLTTVTKCDGEATANNRKGKLIFFYEWVITVDWIADMVNDDAEQAKGELEILNLSEENEPRDIDINVTVTAGGDAGDAVKKFLIQDGTKQIQDLLAIYIVSLREEYALDLILPTTATAAAAAASKKSQAASKSRSVVATKLPADTSVSNTTNRICDMKISHSDAGCKLEVRNLNLRTTFKCAVSDLYNVLTTNEMVAAFTRGPVKMEAKKGGKFELFGGNITGAFVELVHNERLVQTWRFKTWPEGHHSTVTLDFAQKEDCMEVSLEQTGIPTNDYERTKEGWNNYYWESMKRTFGFGATLM